jgi:hypothetical protein
MTLFLNIAFELIVSYCRVLDIIRAIMMPMSLDLLPHGFVVTQAES